MKGILSRIRKWGMDKWLILLLGGVLLLVICIPSKKSSTIDIMERDRSFDTEAGGYDNWSGQTSLLYDHSQGWLTEVTIGQQLEEVLQKIDGVGQVHVMITSNSEYNQIEGVVVVAEGADVPVVRQEITETVQALFPIAAYKVKVCKMAGGKS